MLKTANQTEKISKKNIKHQKEHHSFGAPSGTLPIAQLIISKLSMF
jgi:hypothetical protein